MWIGSNKLLRATYARHSGRECVRAMFCVSVTICNDAFVVVEYLCTLALLDLLKNPCMRMINACSTRIAFGASHC